MLKGYRLIGLYLLCVMALIVWLCSCKSTEFVPIEVTKTETLHEKDTVNNTVVINNEKETVLREARPEDSAMIASLGIKLNANERLLILLQKELSDTKKELFESHRKDSVRADNVQVPAPMIERKLSRWEQVCLDYGKVMMGGTIVAVIMIVVIIIWWIRRIRNNI